MNKLLLLAVIASCLSTMPALAGTQMVYSTTSGEPFETTGFVVSYEGGICRQGNINYLLESTDHRTNIWLSASGHNEFVLRHAMITHGLYCITGNWQQGADCPYVEVTNVHWD
jgi:hypothetical protein